MKLSDTEIASLIKDLGSYRASKRERAAEILWNRRNESIEPLLTSLIDEAVVYEMQSDSARILWRCRWIMFLALMFVILTGDKEVIDNASLFLILAVFSPSILLAIGMAVSRPTRRFTALLKIIENSKEPRVIGILLNLLQYRQTALYAHIETIVLKQFQALNSSEIPSLDLKQRKILCRMLFQQGSDKSNIITILSVLQQTGSGESIPAIKRMITEGHTDAIRKAAKRCLDAIESRQKEGNAHDTLLRASENSGGQEELLRPANVNMDTHAETLLRVPTEE